MVPGTADESGDSPRLAAMQLRPFLFLCFPLLPAQRARPQRRGGRGAPGPRSRSPGGLTRAADRAGCWKRGAVTGRGRGGAAALGQLQPAHAPASEPIKRWKAGRRPLVAPALSKSALRFLEWLAAKPTYYSTREGRPGRARRQGFSH